MRAMHPKSPAKRSWGIHRANILPPRGVFAVRSPRIMHGAQILPPSGDPAPAQGLLPEQLHHGIAFQRPGPCAGMTSHTGRGSRTLLNGLALAQGCLPPQRLASTRHLPIPAARRARCSQRQAADELRRRSSGAWPAVRPSPEGPPTTSSRGQADNGMLRRTGPGFQNREQAGAEPPAEDAGPAGPAAALPKTPIERTNPSWRNYRNTPLGAVR